MASGEVLHSKVKISNVAEYQMRKRRTIRAIYASRMDHTQPKMFLEGIEVVIAMEQRVPGLQTEGSDQAINGCAHLYPACRCRLH
jgi:hypothetical protein